MPMNAFNDRFAPITTEIGFLECDAKNVAEAFLDWQLPIQLKRGVTMKLGEVYGSLEAKITNLLPLTSIESRRFLFMPTNSNWTAYVDNGWRGTDVFSTVSYLAMKLGCKGIRAVSVSNTMRKLINTKIGRYGATQLEFYSGKSNNYNFLNIQRSVSVANDGGRWRFDANGEPMSFEQSERYKDKSIQNRFTPTMLDDYLRNFGIHFFLPEFYEVNFASYLISKLGPSAENMKEYSLEEVHANF